MSSLNLVPNPTVFLVQTGVFVANLFVVKKLLLEPYLKVKAKRDKLTHGSKQDAHNLNLDNEKRLKDINDRLDQTRDNAKKRTDDLLVVTQKRRDELLRAAEKESKDFLSQAQQDIAKALGDERSKVPAIVRALTEDLYTKTIH